jgi:hypothetical protein
LGGLREEGNGGDEMGKGNKKIFYFLFAEKKKFPTFAVPNETGVAKRSSVTIKKDWNNGMPGSGGTLRPPGHHMKLQHIQAAVMRAGKFIKEISFFKKRSGAKMLL